MKMSNEEKVALRMAQLTDSVTLDLDQVGKYLAKMPNTYYNRLMIMIESAEWEKENGGYDQERLF